MATRDELIAALAGRYGEAGRIERGRILDEFVAVSGYQRLLADPRTPEPVRHNLTALQALLDPVALLQKIRRKHEV
jgi:hypothetical protein